MIKFLCEPFACLAKNYELTKQLTKRNVEEKFKGSILGSSWSLISPLLMLSVYTFFFSVVFKARWGGGGVSDSKAEFAIVLFCGLMIFNFFSECINKAPYLIIGNVNFVKKVVFPLEVLSWVNVFSGLINFLVSFGIWFIFYLFVFGAPNGNFIFFPLILVPLLLFLLGGSWLLSSLSVYIRDITQLIPPITSVLLFMSPIFYALSSLPENYHIFFMLNPITPIVEEARSTLIYNNKLDLNTWLWAMSLSVVVFYFGYFCFKKTKKGFADVL